MEILKNRNEEIMNKLLSDKEVEDLSIEDKKRYYENLRDYCLQLPDNQPHFGQDLIHRVYPKLIKYQIIPEGDENIPKDKPVIFVVNHSNSHDIFTMYECLSRLGRKASAMVATDCLNPITTTIFKASNATLLDRMIKESRGSSVLRMAHKTYLGYDSFICGESTWNLHPTKSMHNIKKGPVKIQAITKSLIIPTIMEYIEVDNLVQKEKDLYIKCVIRFGKPIEPDYNNSMIDQAQLITAIMSAMRKEIWKEYNITRDQLSDIDPEVYINHTYLKKYTPLFEYKSEIEQKYLHFNEGEPHVNEYRLDANGILVPGVTEKNDPQAIKILQKCA